MKVQNFLKMYKKMGGHRWIKFISIRIGYFKLKGAKDYIYHSSLTLEGLNKKDELRLEEDERDALFGVDVKHLSESYLVDLGHFSGEVKETLDEWLYFFRHLDFFGPITAKGLGA